MPPGYRPGGGSALEGGVPWESSHGGFLGRWWETVTAVNFRGRPFFAAAAQSNDPLPACLFSMTTMAIFMFIALLLIFTLYAIIGAAFFAALGGIPGGGRLTAGLAGVGLIIFAVYLVVLTVVYAIIGFIAPWIGGGLHHLGLMLFGGVGAGRGYGDTVRAHAYAQAASLLWIPIPIVGGFVSLIFSIINHVNAYDEVHQCGGGKAFLAWLSPVLICCCCYAMAAMLGIAAGGF